MSIPNMRFGNFLILQVSLPTLLELGMLFCMSVCFSADKVYTKYRINYTVRYTPLVHAPKRGTTLENVQTGFDPAFDFLTD